ncbi:hypothetical protein CVT26_014365 [Gymnopilus dilepis]|uniref:Peptidase M24 domain-containing protein n=1 Tax=Gymnopilus dilepis TaxID=231916 RepID=A0A409Y7P0_9AGAR|nr:hypothetical protein CVT26_014365 [Gymnopilus dilepis]
MSDMKAQGVKLAEKRSKAVSVLFFVGFVFVLSTLFYRPVTLSLSWHAPWLSPYAHLAFHCASIEAISSSEFLARQTELSRTLFDLNATAYIAEPGASSQFFGNFSKSQWSLSERPLLLVISANSGSGFSDEMASNVQPMVTILTPKFEATRARLLPVAAASGQVRYIEWAEEADPYAVLLADLPSSDLFKPRTIFVDNSVRKFIVDGLLHASDQAEKSSSSGVVVLSAPPAITQMRERKSKAEIQILRCVNEATLLAIREVHKGLYPGIRESQARSMMASALGAAGLKDGGCLTLFGENAALPHGSGTDRTLGSQDFALFDCTASLHGYFSDITRTVAVDPDNIPAKHLEIWQLVQSAQTRALAEATNGTLASRVDAAARNFLQEKGYGEFFTHRLGHGIGLEVHEEPYLRGGNNDIIRIGHTFSDEPGIYIEGKVGVRLEDCFYINEDGVGIYLTEEVGGPSKAPWRP